jgi:hypothetical protein
LKCIAAIWVDLEDSPLGTRSRLADELYGTPVLRRTLERVLRCKHLDAAHVLCLTRDAQRVARLVQGVPVKIETHAAGPAPYAELVRAGRSWGLDSWRGGIGGLTVFDEDLHVEALAALAQREGAAAVVSIAAAAALIDPGLIDALIQHYRENVDSARMAFVQAPPGLAAVVLARDLLAELAPTGQPVGALLAYHPDRPMADLTGREACYRASAEVIAASGRLLADTRRGFDRLRTLIESGGENWNAAQIVRWLNGRCGTADPACEQDVPTFPPLNKGRVRVGSQSRESLVRDSPLPLTSQSDVKGLAPAPTGIPSRVRSAEPIPTEIEIELTTDHPYVAQPLSAIGVAQPPSAIGVAQPPSAVNRENPPLLHPRIPEIPARGPIRQSVIDAVIDAIKDYDDVRIVLGGFGEPCLHPAFPEICAALRRSAALAIAVRTSALLGGTKLQPLTQTRVQGLQLCPTIDRVDSALFETPIDAVEVILDAATAQTYSRVHGFDGFESVLARLERWIDRRIERQQVRPLIVPSFIKSVDNLDDMEAFFDTWQRRLGAALITGYSHCAGQRPDRAVTSMAPPRRTTCRRVFSRAHILADGRMTTCDQDFAGRQTLGVVGHEPFESLWESAKLNQVRANDIAGLSLCQSCDEWHRP